LGGGGLWGVSHRAHVLFKRACLVNGKMASSGLAGVDAVKASYGAVAQEARVFLGVGAFLGVFPGSVPRVSADVAVGVFRGPLAVCRGV
jgi:hypothetical protein